MAWQEIHVELNYTKQFYISPKHGPYFILSKQTKERAHFSCCRWACLLSHNSLNQDVIFETSTPLCHSTLNSAQLFVLKKPLTQIECCKWHQYANTFIFSFYTLIQNSLWAIQFGAKPRPAMPNYHARSAFFWDIMQCSVVIQHRHFRTNDWPHLPSRNPRGNKT
jgi:hypothetical protein